MLWIKQGLSENLQKVRVLKGVFPVNSIWEKEAFVQVDLALLTNMAIKCDQDVLNITWEWLS